MPRGRLQLLLALALVLAASYYWEPSPDPVADQKTVARRLSLPQTYLLDTRSWAYSEEGRLTEIMEASRAEHFPPEDYTLMEAPRFYAHNRDNKTWSASASLGRFRHKFQRLTLSQDVTLTHDQTGTRLETKKMSIDLAQKIATSEKPVTITQGLNQTQARGMVANLELEEILLAPEVESIYVQPQP
jgi:LPS export ABC transporter protein LptC